ncbi:uncharacterized protein ARMOST_17682 [Armillaria ostoyae]|uniref:Uncharacterized protein n=1 Tax=Armillaria ostoyae TaxID=47428 RepID=A0A284RZV2_ARMOS|nr:uncharacterized protein ARMOST_17682 [Armillaria ostoyae]
MSSELYDVNVAMASSVIMGQKNKPGTAPRIPQMTPQMLQPDSGFSFALDGSSPLPRQDLLGPPPCRDWVSSPSTSVPPSSIKRFIHARLDLINLARSPSAAARYTPRGVSIRSRSIPIPWNLYARLEDASQTAGGLSRAATRRMGCRYTMERPNTKGTERQERRALICMSRYLSGAVAS